MSIIMYYVISVVLAAFILYDLYLMSSPKTAVKGNLIGAAAIAAAIILTLIYYQIVELKILWISLLIGSTFGLYLGSKVKMIQMPEMVAFLHGLGGIAAVLVSVVILYEPDISNFTKFTGTLALVVGGLTFSGSMIAASKLHNIISSKPIVFKGHSMISILTMVFMAILVFASLFTTGSMLWLIITGSIVSIFFGYWFTIRVGGADMPITISLLNSTAGVTGGMLGLATYDPVLVAGGGIVAAAGFLLTQVMCKGNNSSVLKVMTGKTTVSGKVVPKKSDTFREETKESQGSGKKTEKEIFKEAEKIIIVPGYGMALAQAQTEVKQLADILEHMGKKVDYAIHPVAGRMPGHMNVLLAEVDVDYDKLLEMEQINPEFTDTDLVLIVGANDVVNPAAITEEGTPIYGMPILEAFKAKNIIICNFDTKPGYAGVDNPLYKQENVLMLLGDAKGTVNQLLRLLQESRENVVEVAVANLLTEKEIFEEAKKIIIVPGYGMALAQAQTEVKQLADILEKKGKKVNYAIHPVAGRMPGHMNVLLAEVDVDYDKLLEMEQINPEFTDTDLVLIVGANDVVNPAAITEEGTPIYGMPILEAFKAKNIIICNFDTKPGYAGVDNPLYKQENVLMLLGDAKGTVANLVRIAESI